MTDIREAKSEDCVARGEDLKDRRDSSRKARCCCRRNKIKRQRVAATKTGKTTVRPMGVLTSERQSGYVCKLQPEASTIY